MTVRLAPLLLIIGLIFGVTGAVFGFSAINRGGVSCGSAFKGSNAATVADYASAIDADNGLSSGPIGGRESACTAARTDRRPYAETGVILGVLALLGAGIVLGRARPTLPPAAPATPV